MNHGIQRPELRRSGRQYMLLTAESSFQPKQYFLMVETLVKATRFMGVGVGPLALAPGYPRRVKVAKLATSTNLRFGSHCRVFASATLRAAVSGTAVKPFNQHRVLVTVIF